MTELKPRVIALDLDTTGYQRILGGPPGSVAMRSGLVQLPPGEAVGEHSTHRKEELIIVLGGEGELRLNGSGSMAIAHGMTAYCPPDTEHNVVNTGTDVLRYVYVVSEVGPGPVQ